MAHVVGISLEHEMSLLAAFLLINACEDIFSKQFRRVENMIIEIRVNEGPSSESSSRKCDYRIRAYGIVPTQHSSCPTL